MKLKHKIKQIGLLAGIGLVAISFLASVYTAVHPAATSAAGAASAAIVANQYGPNGEKLVDYSAYQCIAVIHKPTKLNTSNGGGFGGVYYFGKPGGIPSGDPQKTLSAANNGQNMLYVSFEGAGNTKWDKACEGALGFVQSISSGSSTSFYGGWGTGNNSGITYAAATVSTVGTISFTLPNSAYNAQLAKPYTLQLNDPDGVLKNKAYFPTGGGTTQTGNCFESAANDNDLSSCISHTANATFTDAATIIYAGDTYTATTWGNNTMVYKLTKGSDSTRLNSGAIPELDMDTTNADSDINMDNKGSLKDINEIARALQKAAQGGNTLKLGLTNYDAKGDKSSGTVTADDRGMDVFANYYPQSDTVSLVFASSGNNESPYFGTYARTDATHYAITGSGINGCNASKPVFVFATDPHSLNSTHDGITNVNWRLPSSGNCAYGNVPVVVVIMPADAVAPTPNGNATCTASTTTCSHDSNPTCETVAANPLTWILCPVYNTVADFSDWLFQNIVEPFLVTSPISTDPGDPIYKIWSSFRIYANIFLVIALLVIVFGQSIGGGLVDAYTAKKVLPRLLIAAIFINLSLYIVGFMVDVTNVVGGSIGKLMTDPLAGAGAFNITPSGVGAGKIVGTSLAAAGGTTVAVGVGAALFGVAAKAIVAKAILPVLLFIIMPAVFGLIAAFLTLVLRKGIILALVLVSPVAFALYCLPNTEKYFRKWWDFLFEALLVYPIVIVFFAVADILSVTIVKANGSGSGIALLISFLLQFLPLVFIPFAFRLAGGAVGKVHEVLSGSQKRLQEGIKGNAANPLSLRNRAKQNLGAAITRSQAQSYRNMKGRFPRLASSLYGSSIEKEALLNQSAKQRIGAIKDNGDDSIVNARASFIETDRTSANFGKRMTLDGKEVGKADWMAAQRLYPNLSDIQAVADYRSTKINSTEEAHQFERNFGLMGKQLGLTPDETTGVFTGLSFARQIERGEMKHSSYDKDYNFHAAGDYGSFAGEVDHNGKVATVESSRSGNLVKEGYTKKDGFTGAKALGSYFVSTADIKKEHIDRLNTGMARDGKGGRTVALSPELRQHSEDQLRQILEQEEAWTRGGRYKDPDSGDIVESGMSGASAQTISAFNKMRDLGKGDANVDRIRREIATGQTYEATHSPDPGDFSPGSRPYKP